jgi:murein DD-endopeptidase MepM/ murein hydrolase activator NlpD
LVPVFFLACVFLAAQSASELPHIQRLNTQDIVFQQYLADVEAGRRAVFSRYPARTADEIVRELTIYRYNPAPDDELFLIVARCNIPYDTFATLNRWGNMPLLSPTGAILMPSIPGIFIPEEPESDLEQLIFSSRGDEAGASITIMMPSGKEQKFRFIPGDSLTPNERVFFLNPGQFRFPLHSYRLTSAFGMRVSPISGRKSMHGGLDLAAPTGTAVYAARDGVVSFVGSSPVYGTYIIITHTANWTSLYGHLSSVSVHLHDDVHSGSLIGEVGSTGLSTGPHLHFELRQNGKAQDPKTLLRAGVGSRE